MILITQEIFIVCELKMYTAVQVCLQELHRPTFNRVATRYSEFKRCSFNASLNFLGDFISLYTFLIHTF